MGEVKDFKAPEEYLDMLMVKYVDGFELLQKYLDKHHPNSNFSSLEIWRRLKRRC